MNDACSPQALCTGTLNTCSDGLNCTVDVCNEATDACDITISVGCVVDGECRGLLADNPGNACQQCNPLFNASAWSNKPPGAFCSDGAFCTVNDACNGSGSCASAPRVCSDGITCTVDVCNEGSDQCVYTLGGGCIIGGVCYAADDEDPLNSCHVCTPGTSTSAWTNKAPGADCDDGLFCTEDDSCSAQAICTGAQISCDDLDTCTVDICNELAQGCDNTIELGCTINNDCVAPLGVNPANPCEVCVPSLDPIGWTLRVNNEVCDDGVWCTTGDTCGVAGVCLGQVRNCDDGISCTLNTCNELTHRCDTVPDAGLGFSCTIDGSCYAALQDDPTGIVPMASHARPTPASRVRIPAHPR